MPSSLIGSTVLALALAPAATLAPAAHAQNVCVVVTTGGLMSYSTGPTCVTTPLPTRPLHHETGVSPYVWVEVSVTYP